MPNISKTVEQVWRAREQDDKDFERHFCALLSDVWRLSPCPDPELLTLYTEAAISKEWGEPVFATEEEVLSFNRKCKKFLTETWTELEWDHSKV